jgi:zinc protease
MCKYCRYHPIVILSLLVLLTVTAWAEEFPAPEQVVVPEVKYTHFKLDNGLVVYVFEDHQASLAEVNLWYKVGAADDPEGMSGISHLLEHTMFLGTETLGKEQANALIRQVGGKSNAATSYYYTKYYEKVPTASLELALAIEADRMHNLKIDPAEFQREREVVKQERRRNIDSSAFGLALEEIEATAFEASPLGHAIIGNMVDIDRLTPKMLQEYYRRYYAPNNAILSVSGDVNPQNLLGMVKKYFGAYQPQTIKRKIATEPDQQEERRITVKKATKIPYILMLYKLPPGNHPDIPAIQCLLDVLVYKRVWVALQLDERVISGASFFLTRYPDLGCAQIILRPINNGKMAAVESGFDAELHDLIQNGVTDEELQHIKKNWIRYLVFKQRETRNSTAMVMDGVIKYNDPEYYHKVLKSYADITGADLIRVAQKYFVNERRTVGYVVSAR